MQENRESLIENPIEEVPDITEELLLEEVKQDSKFFLLDNIIVPEVENIEEQSFEQTPVHLDYSQVMLKQN